jgi:putative transposase
MSRPLRIQYPGAWYHVLNRGRRKETVFATDHDYMAFVEILADSSALWDVRIAAFCLMPNHYHLLLQTPLANLSRCMRHIDGIYTQRANRRHRGEGQVFRGRYKSILVDAEAYLLQLVRYIHRNPVNAGLVRSLCEYRWSSHHDYVSSPARWDWLYKEFILRQFCSTRSRAVRSYLRFVSKGEPDEVAEFFSQVRLPPIMGDEEFIESVQQGTAVQRRHPEIPDSVQLMPSVEKIMAAVSTAYGLREGMLCNGRRGERNEARSVAIYLMRRLRGEGLMDIARVFGLKRHSSVSTHVQLVEARAGADQTFRRVLDSLEAKVRQPKT